MKLSLFFLLVAFLFHQFLFGAVHVFAFMCMILFSVSHSLSVSLCVCFIIRSLFCSILLFGFGNATILTLISHTFNNDHS